MNPRDHKPELKVGDRVAVYTHGMGRVVGVVSETREDGFLRIERTPSGVSCGHWFHVKQCRRLRKKEKPAEERVERWTYRDSLGFVSAATWVRKENIPESSGALMHLVELRSGEAIVSRSSLAKAVDRIPLSMDSLERDEQITKPLCKLLGLGGQK